MVEMNMEISGQDYPLYHGGEEQGKAGDPDWQYVRSLLRIPGEALFGLPFSSLGFPTTIYRGGRRYGACLLPAAAGGSRMSVLYEDGDVQVSRFGNRTIWGE